MSGKPSKQLAEPEQRLIDTVIRKRGSPTDALNRVNDRRRTNDVKDIGRNAAYRYLNGTHHVRGEPEHRGKKKILTKSHVRRLDLARRRWIRRANNQKRVTYNTRT